jgi:hypothetical protein
MLGMFDIWQIGAHASADERCGAMARSVAMWAPPGWLKPHRRGVESSSPTHDVPPANVDGRALADMQVFGQRLFVRGGVHTRNLKVETAPALPSSC